MAKHSIGLIPADGIGPEVVTQAVRVLRALAKSERGLAFSFTKYPWGAIFITRRDGCVRRIFWSA